MKKIARVALLKYAGLRSQIGLLAHETYYYVGYLLRRPFFD